MNLRTGRSLSFRELWPMYCITAIMVWCLAWSSICRGEGIYQDMMSRCPQWGMRQIRNADKATQCHEATHFVNHDLSVSHGQDYGAFYIGDGTYHFLTSPNVTIGQVARYVPESQRTGRFHTYLSGDRVGRNCLSILDEWVCYTNDAQCTQELGLRPDGGLKFANEFTVFTDHLLHAVRTHDPSYRDMSKLLRFIKLQKDRVNALNQYSR